MLITSPDEKRVASPSHLLAEPISKKRPNHNLGLSHPSVPLTLTTC